MRNDDGDEADREHNDEDVVDGRDDEERVELTSLGLDALSLRPLPLLLLVYAVGSELALFLELEGPSDVGLVDSL